MREKDGIGSKSPGCFSHLEKSIVRPLAIVKAFVAAPGQAPTLKFGNTDLSGLDFEAIIRMVEAGLIGKIVEIEQDDGTHIIVEVM